MSDQANGAQLASMIRDEDLKELQENTDRQNATKKSLK
jgi:hypothetical protein